MKSQRFIVAAIALGIASLPGFAQQANVAGVPNFHQVNDHVYRGAQPTAPGFQSLAKLGVKTIIDLCEPNEHATPERQTVEAAGMRYVSIPLHGMSSPSTADIAKVLALFDDPANGPVFVHCHRGADRTGTVVACYRVAHDGWNNDKALKEAKDFGMSWTEIAMKSYVKGYRPALVTATAGASAGTGANN